MRHPILRLAAIGFATPARQALAAALADHDQAGPRWALARHERADAWLVHPDVVDLEADHARVWDSADRVAAATVHFDRIVRPVAIASGAAAGGFTPALPPAALQVRLLDSLEPASVARLLLQFEKELRLVRSRFAFGEIFLMTRPDVTKEQRGYQLSYRQQLVALVDTLNMRVHLGTKAVPISIAEAVWQPRPLGAAAPSDSEFKTCTVQECLWDFSQRTVEVWLPSRYKSSTIHFWRTPSLRAGHYEDEHIGLLALIKQRPQDFSALKARVGWDEERVLKTLEGLWVTGAISTQPAKAANAPGLLERLFARRSVEPDSNLDSDSASQPSSRSLDWARDTTPAELEETGKIRLN